MQIHCFCSQSCLPVFSFHLWKLHVLQDKLPIGTSLCKPVLDNFTLEVLTTASYTSSVSIIVCPHCTATSLQPTLHK